MVILCYRLYPLLRLIVCLPVKKPNWIPSLQATNSLLVGLIDQSISFGAGLLLVSDQTTQED